MNARHKYPRTFHLPTSPGGTDDDKILASTAQFTNQEVVVTEKLDGENTTIGQTYSHARSTDSRHHESRSTVKALQAQVGHTLPTGWRICGENLYAKHSIGYSALPAFFLMFSIWDESNTCLDWDQTKEWAKLLGLQTVPTIYRGPFNGPAIQALWEAHTPSYGAAQSEGYVVRATKSFGFDSFKSHTGKYVRKGHVQTTSHWMHQIITPNELGA
jgi:hypothetical protein